MHVEKFANLEALSSVPKAFCGPARRKRDRRSWLDGTSTALVYVGEHGQFKKGFWCRFLGWRPIELVALTAYCASRDDEFKF